MHRDLISQAIATAHGLPASTGWGCPELEAAKAKAEMQLEMEYHNAHPRYSEIHWNHIPTSRDCREDIQEVIDGVAELQMPLELYTGKGFGYFYNKDGTMDHYEHDLYKIAWKNEGHEVQFDFIVPEDVPFAERKKHWDRGRVKGRFYTVATSEQGSFWRAKNFWGMMKDLFLEHLGYNSWVGTATWSINSEIKNQPANKQDDWRWGFSYVGVDKALNPIWINNLLLFYYRLNFVANPYAHENTDDLLADREVSLLGDAAAKRTREMLGEKGWRELTKYNKANASKWKRLQRQRMKRVDKEELEHKKKIALEQIIERQLLIDKHW